ncbi:MAG: hypothetical protein ABJN84_10800 [Flavobacteriaceae bacterium]
MKSIIQKLRMLPLLFLGMTLMTAVSCSEDEAETPVEPEDISFRVNLTKIKATDTSGEGNANNVELEIFGELSTSLTIGTTVDTRVLWSADAEGAIGVGQNDTQLTAEEIFTVSEDELSQSSITCAGDLEENDGGGFIEDQGEESSTFTLSSITGTQDIELTFSEPEGQTAVVTFTVTRL